MNVWITGAGGLIGSYLTRTAPTLCPRWEICGLSRANLDLTDFKNVRRRFAQDKPQSIIHCAALTKTPACQQNPALARKMNIEVTEMLAELATEIPFVFLSTDLVFDGRKGNYVEADPVNPLNVYAETKAAAEHLVLRNPRHTVIRTSLNFGDSPTGDRSFGEELRLAWQAGKTLRLFTDEFRCPIAATVTAEAVWSLAACNRPGLYHLAGAERLSRWQIGQLLAARWPQLNPRLESASLREYRGAPRSPDTSLDCTRLQSLLPFPLPRFSDWLAANVGDFGAAR
jgi:dTDP-4-dehydrorhamnose reductase